MLPYLFAPRPNFLTTFPLNIKIHTYHPKFHPSDINIYVNILMNSLPDGHGMQV